MKQPHFPKKPFQFWTFISEDRFNQEKAYPGQRLDLKHPVFDSDSHKNQNVLVFPDIMINAKYFMNMAPCIVMMDKDRIPWEQKKPLAYWVGNGTGTMVVGGGLKKNLNEKDWRGRLRLMKYSIDNPDLIFAYFSGTWHKWIEEPGVLPKEKLPYLHEHHGFGYTGE